MDLVTLLALLVLLAGVVAVPAPAVHGGTLSLVGVVLAALGGSIPFGVLGVLVAVGIAVAAVYAEANGARADATARLTREQLGVTFALAFLGSAVAGAVGVVLAVAAAVAAVAARDAPGDSTDAALDAVAPLVVPLLLTGTLLLVVQVGA